MGERMSAIFRWLHSITFTCPQTHTQVHIIIIVEQNIGHSYECVLLDILVDQMRGKGPVTACYFLALYSICTHIRTHTNYYFTEFSPERVAFLQVF